MRATAVILTGIWLLTGPKSLCGHAAVQQGGVLDSIMATAIAFADSVSATAAGMAMIDTYEARDSVAESLRAYQLTVLGRLNELLRNHPEEEDHVVERLGYGDLDRTLRRVGFRLDYVEGTPWLGDRVGFLRDSVGVYISEPLRRYWSTMALDQTHQLSNDAVLTVTWSEVGARWMRWADLAMTYPTVGHADEARDWARYYRRVFLLGLPGSPVFEFGDGEVGGEVRRAYAEFVERYANTGPSEIVAEYVALLRQEGWRRTTAVNRWISEMGVDRR